MPGGKSLPAVSWLRQEDAVLLSFSVSAPKHPQMGGLLLLRWKQAGAGWAGSWVEKRVLLFFQGFFELGMMQGERLPTGRTLHGGQHQAG